MTIDIWNLGSGDGIRHYQYLPGTTSPTGETNTLEDLLELRDQIFGVRSMEAPSQDPTVEEFLAWHPLQQRDLLEPGIETTIGSGSDIIHVIKSLDGERVYILESLQKGDIARMSTDDQTLISATETWLSTTSVVLDMVPTNGVSLTETKAKLLETLNVIRAKAESPTLSYYDGTETFDGSPFLAQLDVLETKISNAGILSESANDSLLSQLNARLDRAISFFDVRTPSDPQPDDFKLWLKWTEGYDLSTDPDKYAIYDAAAGSDNPEATGSHIIFDKNDYDNDGGKVQNAYQNITADDIYDFEANPFRNIISLDNNQKINLAYKLFIEQEYRVAAAMQQKELLTSTGTLNGRRLDVPTMIAYYQLLTHTEIEAIVAMDTEEIAQYNYLQQDRTVFKDLVNQHLEGYDPTKTGQKRSFLGLDDGSIGDLPLQDLKSIGMFANGLQGDPHPIEKNRNLPRVGVDIIDWPTTKDLTNLERYDNLSRSEKDRFDPDRIIPSTFNDNERFFTAMIKDTDLVWNSDTKTAWDTRATRLQESDSLLNQDTQIKNNDLGNTTKQGTRIFDMVNSMLSNVLSSVSKVTF